MTPREAKEGLPPFAGSVRAATVTQNRPLMYYFPAWNCLVPSESIVNFSSPLLWLLRRPIFHLQIRDVSEIGDIRGYQYRASCKRDGSDLQVLRSEAAVGVSQPFIFR